MAKKPPDLTAKTGITRTPTTLFSVRPGPGNWVCFWNQTSARCMPIRPSMIPGNRRMCTAYSRGMMMSPGKSPPKIAQCIQVPISGMPSVIDDSAARMPVPESRSSGSE